MKFTKGSCNGKRHEKRYADDAGRTRGDQSWAGGGVEARGDRTKGWMIVVLDWAREWAIQCCLDLPDLLGSVNSCNDCLIF